MATCCFACNATVGKAINIFGNECPLQSRLNISEVLSELVDKPLMKATSHSQVLCRKCYATISEYDSLKIRLQVIKTEFLDEWKKVLLLQNLSYDTYGVSPLPNCVTRKKVVLPASKLQPVPPNYLLDIGKIATVSKPNLSSANTGVFPQAMVKTTVTKPAVNLVVTVGSTVLTQTLNSAVTTSQSKITLSPSNVVSSPQKSDYSITDKMISSLVSTNRSQAKKKPYLSFNVNSLPKDLLSSASGNIAVKNEDANNDDQAMEIDEDCTLAVAVTADDNGKLMFDSSPMKNKSIDIKPKSNFFDVGLLLSQDGSVENEKDEKFILDKLKILNEADNDEDENDTIVMEDGERATIIRVGVQRVMFDGKKISLVQNSDNETNDNDDNLDSNDESQIELQVSGDEDIANALINAAREQGGAFIKVESGEMYRVETVQSQVKEETDTETSHLQNIVERESDGLYKCLLCTMNINRTEAVKGDAESIMSHLKSEHTARAYICLVCGIVIRKKTEYTTHIENHASRDKTLINKSKLHECTVCKKKYISRSILNEHMNVHAGTRPYTCAVCGKTFASKYTHQAHLKTHSSRPRPFKCKQCNKTFFTQQNLNQHEKTHSGLKEFICTICNKAFATQHNLEVHGVIHSGQKPYPCTVCPKAFARRAELRDHMRIHTGERPFACDICGATFTQRSNLHSHKRATHLDDKRHLCQLCPKRFKRRRLLDYHLKAAHTGERPLQCEICKATFVYPEHYKKHARIHSGEKPYDCEVCGKAFTSRDNRNMHRFVHSDKKPYECLTCGAGYMRKQLLYTHMNTTGHVAESIVVNQPRVIKTVENGLNTPLIDVHGIELKNDKLSDPLMESIEELQLDEDRNHENAAENDDTPKLFITEDKKIILQNNKASINLVQDSEAAFLSLHNLNGLMEASTEDKLDEQAQIITTDEKGATVRLIQIQLADGNTGWVAINHHDDNLQ
ncbi:unnamed protein product [Chilo suppressalis]|uniref:C2H2-type domain-containing protein n=1 Tax=Chilo suppressalis TaxID=168631 RepID=A0ABN8B609_CHISP|nr:unnamed protein product [Chilo suppressalis]